MAPVAALNQIPPALWFAAASAVLIWVVTRPRLAKQALHLVMSHPAYLVPAAMAVVGIAATTMFGQSLPGLHPHTILHENPFSTLSGQLRAGLGWAGLGIVSVALAGLVGLLEAHVAGDKPSSDAFRAGIRRHTATIFLAKVLLALLVSVVLGWLTRDGGREVLLVVCLVPSLVLAPVLGATARHPNRPAAALRDTFGIVQREMWFVGRLITAEAVFLVGLFVLWGRALAPTLPFQPFDEIFGWNPIALGQGASALSFNHFPFVLGTTDRLVSGIAVLAAAFTSTVFVTAHFLGATRGYAMPEPLDVDETDVQSVA